MNIKSGKKTAAMAMAAVVFLSSVYCTFSRLPKAFSQEESLCMAAGLAMPVSNNIEDDEAQDNQSESSVADKAESATKPADEQKTEKATAKPKEYGGEAYPVIENQYGSAGEITIKNTTDFDIDVDYELSQPLGFEPEKTDEPQVLIVHTHTTEAYLQQDNGVYYSEYTGRSKDDSENITLAGRAMADSLSENGIKALHSATHHDDPSYNGSYDRSAATIYEYLEKYPSIKVIIDFHRDSIGYGGEDGKIKPTFMVNGEKAAQIMIMSGYDPAGNYDYAHWEENLRFALKIQQKAEQLYPGMTRPLYFGDFAYNMNINSGSLLIEVGTEVNTLDEACRTGKLLGRVLAKVLKDEM
ncbi:MULTISPECIES: stage II sporulation protein P [unclassified Ruminococcus]|uniref:stage II sporulation protein P n=1 Tax=unclassified Ruminococcus TaxID=2608920 RepID=UPI0021093EF3|nr:MULTISPECIES: stage II sporulation protein P [unclassified Ruminococcus]MCQ4022187.1 hypothetical protein [Ruminococcus sp. zg-924]MCQ4115585.1 hypothetical protein [Ruminococcus sp. zg-921]